MALAEVEPSVKYHPYCTRALTHYLESGRETVLGGQFDWGGCLIKSN